MSKRVIYKYWIEDSSSYDSVSDSILEFDYEFIGFIQDDFKKKLKKEINKVSAIYMDNKKFESFIVTKLT